MPDVCENPSLPEAHLIAFEVREVDIYWGFQVGL
jgi:hypothetical protein